MVQSSTAQVTSETKVIRLLWVAFTSFQPLLALLAFIVTSRIDNIEGIFDASNASAAFSELVGGSYVVALPLVIAGFASMVASFLVPPILAQRLRNGAKGGAAATATANTPLGAPLPLPLPVTVIRYALIEFCGLMGFVTAVVTTQPVLGLPSLAAAFVVMLISRPL